MTSIASERKKPQKASHDRELNPFKKSLAIAKLSLIPRAVGEVIQKIFFNITCDKVGVEVTQARKRAIEEKSDLKESSFILLGARNVHQAIKNMMRRWARKG